MHDESEFYIKVLFVYSLFTVCWVGHKTHKFSMRTYGERRIA